MNIRLLKLCAAGCLALIPTLLLPPVQAAGGEAYAASSQEPILLASVYKFREPQDYKPSHESQGDQPGTTLPNNVTTETYHKYDWEEKKISYTNEELDLYRLTVSRAKHNGKSDSEADQEGLAAIVALRTSKQAAADYGFLPGSEDYETYAAAYYRALTEGKSPEEAGKFGELAVAQMLGEKDKGHL